MGFVVFQASYQFHYPLFCGAKKAYMLLCGKCKIGLYGCLYLDILIAMNLEIPIHDNCLT